MAKEHKLTLQIETKQKELSSIAVDKERHLYRIG